MKMLTRVMAILLVTSLFLSGCGYQDQITELESELAEKEEELQSTQTALEDTRAALNDAKSTIREQESDLATLRNNILALQEEVSVLEGNRPERARLQVELLPNPVLSDSNRQWYWQVSVESMNPIGAHLKAMIRREYWKGELRGTTSWDETDLAGFCHLEDGYLPPYRACSFRGGFPCQALDELGVFLVAFDDNGNTIETPEVRVALVQ